MAKKNYSTHGNNAYAPEPLESVPRKVHQPEKSPKSRPSTRPITRKRIEVREAGSISVDSIFGFFAGGIMAAILINSYAVLATRSDEVVQLRAELSALESQQQVLSAQYEKHFDIARVEEVLGSSLIRPTNDQMVYIDLSQPDAVTIFNDEKKENGFIKAFFDIFSN